MADDSDEIVVFESEDDADQVFRDLAWGNRLRNIPGDGGPAITPATPGYVQVTGAEDGTTHLYPGKVVFLNLEATPPAWIDGDEVRVFPLNSEVLVSGTRYPGVLAGEKDGRQVALVGVGGSAVKRGKLNGNLTRGGNQTVSVFTNVAGTDTDTGTDVTVYDMNLIATGVTLVTGKWVTFYLEGESGRHYLLTAEC